MSNRRSSQQVSRSRVGRPLGPWDRTPAGLRAVIISTPIVFGLFLLNSAGLLIFTTTAITGGLICYPIQILAYGLNGWIAGAQARSSHNKATRVSGKQGEMVRQQHPNYIAQGALAGVVISLVGVVVYFLAGVAAASLLPGLLVFSAAPAVLFIVVDVAIAIGAGIIGGWIYSRFV